MTLADAFDGAVVALSALAVARGHVMRRPIHDAPTSAAMQCERCDRWVVLSIPANPKLEAPELRGDALGRCPGTPHNAVSITDGGLRSLSADGTIA